MRRSGPRISKIRLTSGNYSRASGNHHGLISKYGLMYCRQCFPSYANELGFIKRQDVWSLQVSNRRIDMPLHHVPHRYNVFMCRSFGIPISGREIPILKYTTLSLTRSFNALRESPLVLQLGPAVGIIIFAAWGLGPLMRYSRNLFLHKNDSSWKKSKTHYVFISYLQPLLLWTGATIVCRVLDPVVLPSEASQVVKQRLLNFVRSLSTVLAFTYCLSSFIQQTQNIFKESSGSDDKRKMGFQFAGKAIYTAVWVAAFSLFMELLGFSTKKWVTAGGLGTVLLTLAGREIFTNFLSSVMIHATRPFVMNEWIQTKIEGYEVSGTVEHVGWWSPSVIRGEDREAVHIPNHKFTVSIVRNLTQKSHWRIKTHLAISHLDVNKINNIVADMRKVIAKNPQIEQQRLHRRVFLDNIDPENQALLILVSCFVKTSHFEEYLCVKEAILLDLLRVISHHRARLATPIRTVQKVCGDADIENIPFADTIFARAGAAASRPILLIEPSPRINGDDKAKPRQVPRGNDEQNTTKGNAASENKTTPSASEATVPNNSEKHHRKKGSADTSSTQPSLNSASKKAAGETSPSLEDVEPIDGVDAVSVNTKNEGERLPSARPTTFEDNIVLGVAIEGSKRMLPIEERMVPPPAPVEASELAAGRGGSSTSKGATASDHRDQER